MVTDALRRGFTAANQRPGLILLDIVWKLGWAVASTVAVYVAVAWIAADLSGLVWEDTGNQTLNGLIAASFIRDFWQSHQDDMVVAAALVIGFALFAWCLLEALFRRPFVSDSSAPGPATFYVLLASNVVKVLFLTVAGLLLVPVALAGAPLIAGVMFLAIGFLVVLLDTLIRTDALDLLGTDLFRVAGLIGILVSFELMIGAAGLMLLLAGVLNVARSIEALVMFAACLAVVTLFNLLHGYLLLVRFSAVAIMRRNVIEV